MGKRKTPPTAARDIATRDILALKVAGFATDEIAERLGLPLESTGQMIFDAIAKVTTEVDELAVYEYALASMRIDALLAAVWAAATSGDVRAVEAAAKLLDRRAKLTGSDRERQAPATSNANGYTINITPVAVSS